MCQHFRKSKQIEELKGMTMLNEAYLVFEEEDYKSEIIRTFENFEQIIWNKKGRNRNKYY